MGHHGDETPISVIRSLLAQIDNALALANEWNIGTRTQDDDLSSALAEASRIATKVLERREALLLDAAKRAA